MRIVVAFADLGHSDSDQRQSVRLRQTGFRSIEAAVVEVRTGSAVENFEAQTMVLGEEVTVNLGSEAAVELEVSVEER